MQVEREEQNKQLRQLFFQDYVDFYKNEDSTGIDLNCRNRASSLKYSSSFSKRKINDA